ncbi:DUF2784 family protein [Candidatus Kuenenbacteria bacterium]|nr:DUF2784 family protein [Candidatus Kuenenbacteria bacterium]
MDFMYLILADVVLVFHVLISVMIATLFVFSKAPRWYKITSVVSTVIAVVGFLTYGCPLTLLEKHLRRLAGVETYETGFVVYVLEELLGHGFSVTLRYNLEMILVFSLAFLLITLLYRQYCCQSKS